MQTNRNRSSNRIWQRLALLAATTLLLAACGGQDEPTPTPTSAPPTEAPPTATTAAPTNTPEAASAPESPLDQPESPLAQLESPLTTAPVELPHPKTLEEALALVEETTAPEPTEGNASISGVVFSPGNNQSVYGTGFYLTPADEFEGKYIPPSVYFGPKPENGDVVGETNELGQVFLDNVPPGHYYLMMWTVLSWVSTFDEQEDNLPMLIEVEEGDQLDLGLLYTTWP